MKNSPVLSNFRVATILLLALAIVSPFLISSEASAASKDGRPSIPRNVAAIAVSSTTATVSWRATPTGWYGVGRTSYIAISHPATRRCVTVATRCTFSDLVSGTSYTFTVSARNNMGISPQSAPSTVVIPAVLQTVTFNANGASGSMPPETERAPTALTENSFTNSGYVFMGWSTSPSGVVSLANGDTYSFSSSLNLFAVWSPPSGTNHPTWSGYVDTGATFSSVSGTWTVPTVSCTKATPPAAAYTWVGLDGWVTGATTVEQIGTASQCISGQENYYMWYEMYGDSAVNNGDPVTPDYAAPTYAVAPGDVISASVVLANGVFTLAISNKTLGWAFSINITDTSPAPPVNSAEWIYENPPLVGGSAVSIPDFGSLTFTNGTVGVAGVTSPLKSPNGSYATSHINLVGATPSSAIGSQILASPGAVDTTGTSFTETWQAGQAPNGCVWTTTVQSCPSA